MQSTQAMMTSAHAMWCNGHIRVIDVTKVTSSEVWAIVLHGCAAKSHVIMNTVTSDHCGASCGDGHGGKPLQVTKQSSEAKESATL